MFLNQRTPRGRRAARGFSLVELMVGIAVGMFVVAAAAIMTSGQLTENRRLLLETQLQQDLRAAADIVTRDLRRAGYWATARNGVPAPVGGGVAPSPYGTVTRPSSTTVLYSYDRGPGAASFGFKLDSNGVLQACQADFAAGCGTSGWQDLTDVNTVQITDFSITTTRAGARAETDNGNPLTIPCPALCADGTAGCWPTVQVRELVVSISGRSRSDTAVTRSLQVSVRLRNDGVQLSAEAPSGDACPAS
jgi:Tfp pilus assembly protein PilW